MGNPNKAKGDRAEMAVRDLIVQFFPESWRTRAGWYDDRGDVVLDLLGDKALTFAVQVKDTAGLPGTPEFRALAEQVRNGAHRGGQAYPLSRLFQYGVQPFQAESEVRASLGTGDGVHLIQNDRLHAAQRFAGLGGEKKEQGFRCCDENIGTVTREMPPFGGGGVRGPDCHSDRRRGEPEPSGRVPDPYQW